MVSRVAETRIPNQYGEWRALGYLNSVDGTEHLALVLGDLAEPGRTCWSGCTPSA